MERLPEELYQHIISHFRYSELLPRYFWDPYRYDALENFLAPRVGRPDIKTLRNLRLTSKAFNRAASSIVFRLTCIECKPIQENGIPIPNGLIHSVLLPSPTLTPYIKKLQIGFWNYEVDNGFLQDVDVTSLGEKDAILHLIEHIPRIIEVLPQLESFQILLPKWKSDYDGGPNPGTAPQLDLPLLSTLRTTLGSVLSTNQFSNLTSLRLSLPCAHDFAAIAANIPNPVLAKLRTLFLAITDSTGPGGNKDYLVWAESEDDGDEGFSFSNLLSQYPNTEYADGIFSIVSRCNNLETLGLEGTQHLDANLLNWVPISNGLRNIYLNRVKLSSANLIKLFSPNQTLDIKNSRLSKIWLEAVDLTSGFWEDIFLHLLLCPALEFVNPEDVSYARGSENFEFKEWISRPWENTEPLLSTREEDEEAMWAVRDYVLKQAGGKKHT